MKIKFLALSIAFAAVSVALSFCSKEPVPTTSSAVSTEQTAVDPTVTDRGVCTITVLVVAGSPISVNTPGGIVVITAAMGPVPITVNTPVALLFTSNGPGNSVVSVTGDYNTVGFNLVGGQSKRVGVGDNCGVVLPI